MGIFCGLVVGGVFSLGAGGDEFLGLFYEDVVIENVCMEYFFT